MLKKILPIFSYILHPLFISVYAVLIFFYFGNNYSEYFQIYGIIIQIVIITIFIPITFYYLLLSLKKVDSVMLEQTSQRKIPLLIHAVLLTILIKKSIPVDDFTELYFFFLGSLVSTTLALIMVYFNYKVSLHMIGVTALTVFTMGISWHFQVRMITIIIVLLLCSGLVGSSRLVMKAHSPKELFLGSLIGSIPQLGLLFLWL